MILIDEELLVMALGWNLFLVLFDCIWMSIVVMWNNWTIYWKQRTRKIILMMMMVVMMMTMILIVYFNMFRIKRICFDCFFLWNYFYNIWSLQWWWNKWCFWTNWNVLTKIKTNNSWNWTKEVCCWLKNKWEFDLFNFKHKKKKKNLNI